MLMSYHIMLNARRKSRFQNLHFLFLSAWSDLVELFVTNFCGLKYMIMDNLFALQVNMVYITTVIEIYKYAYKYVYNTCINIVAIGTV